MRLQHPANEGVLIASLCVLDVGYVLLFLSTLVQYTRHRRWWNGRWSTAGQSRETISGTGGNEQDVLGFACLLIIVATLVCAVAWTMVLLLPFFTGSVLVILQALFLFLQPFGLSLFIFAKVQVLLRMCDLAFRLRDIHSRLKGKPVQSVLTPQNTRRLVNALIGTGCVVMVVTSIVFGAKILMSLHRPHQRDQDIVNNENLAQQQSIRIFGVDGLIQSAMLFLLGTAYVLGFLFTYITFRRCLVIVRSGGLTTGQDQLNNAMKRIRNIGLSSLAIFCCFMVRSIGTVLISTSQIQGTTSAVQAEWQKLGWPIPLIVLLSEPVAGAAVIYGLKAGKRARSNSHVGTIMQ